MNKLFDIKNLIKSKEDEVKLKQKEESERLSLFSIISARLRNDMVPIEKHFSELGFEMVQKSQQKWVLSSDKGKVIGELTGFFNPEKQTYVPYFMFDRAFKYRYPSQSAETLIELFADGSIFMERFEQIYKNPNYKYIY